MISKIKAFLELIKFEHTLFALPFAFSGMILGANGIPKIDKIILVILAMISARTVAMIFNRLIDIDYDLENPRTKHRIILIEVISKRVLVIAMLTFTIIFFYVTYLINSVCFKLAPLALFLLLFYSFTKRFTYFTHLILGLVIGIAPSAGYLAVNTNLTLVPVITTIAVMFWVSGFDIIYACQDIQIDRKLKIYSLPMLLGEKKALIIAKIFHFITSICFLILGILINAKMIYYLITLFCIILIFYEHFIIKGDNLNINKINIAFFYVNALISVLMFIAIFLNYVL